MTDARLNTLLERAVQDAPVGSPPLEEMLHSLSARQRRRRIAATCAVGGTAIALAVGSITATVAGGDAPSHTVAGSVDEVPQDESQGDLTETELRTAIVVAREQAEIAGAESISSASALLELGTLSGSNGDADCKSGRLLQIKVVGSFPDLITSGLPDEDGLNGQGNSLGLGRALLITADAQTGSVCQTGVESGEPSPEPGSAPLPLN